MVSHCGSSQDAYIDVAGNMPTLNFCAERRDKYSIIPMDPTAI